MASIAVAFGTHGGTLAAVTLKQLTDLPDIAHVALAAPPELQPLGEGIHRLQATSLNPAAGVAEVLRWFESTGATHLLWALSDRFELTSAGLQRLIAVAEDTQAAILFSDYFDQQQSGGATLHPLVDYQLGSIRDDFDFGHFVLLSHAAVQNVAEEIETDGVATVYGGWYDLRVRASQRGPVIHLAEPTYTAWEVVEQAAGEAHFQYVDPRNRDYQIEMERVATAHLKRIGAWLAPPTAGPVADDSQFPVQCSVVIPVRNRERTVADAVQSALSQEADFPFNVIVVNNHSTDGTTDILRDLAAKDSRIVHIVPKRTDLGIGGCWNEAINAPECGRYAVQLDSDDLYSSPDVLSQVIAEFDRGQYAAVIGSYTIVDFQLQPIPPGLIDHREWTDDNGHNNALRIGGLGAPRAFHVPTLRTIGFPNVSFGEDYAVALRVSRQYKLGRIYSSLYWCRRWEGNTDHQLPLETRNRYAYYKDQLRSIEITARQQ